MSRFVVRPVQESDFDHLQRLARTIQGLTTLPDNDEILQNKIHDSLKAFSPYVRKPGGEAYLFVIEDLERARVIGTSGIMSKVGGFDPFYTYRIKAEPLHCEALNVRKEVRVLHLHVNHNGPTEICSLLVDPAERKHGLGRLSSLSRFLFMAEFPHRFDKSVISELRGVVDKNGNSPFWECVGRHFFDMDFYRADYLTGTGNKEVIANLMPKHPIYVELLPQSAQAVIGEVHEDTRPAKALLEQEGFAFHHEVDIFDAGPTVSAPLKSIRSIKQGKKVRLVSTFSSARPDGAAEFLIANARLDFRCTAGLAFSEKNGEVALDAGSAEALKIRAGEEVRLVPLKPAAKEIP